MPSPERENPSFAAGTRVGNARPISKPRRILCVSTHSTQYDPPVWRFLSARGIVEPTVWYLRGVPPPDAEIGQSVSWDAPLHGYSMEVIGEDRVIARLRTLKQTPDAICLPGYRVPVTRHLLRVARHHGIPTILPTDTIPGGKRDARSMARTLFHSVGCRLFSGFWTTGFRGSEYLSSLGIPGERIARGLYPVDTDYWQQRVQALRRSSRQVREQVSKSSNTFIILAVSKLSERENPSCILRAFRILRTTLPDSQLVLVGDGPLRDSLREQARSVEFAGAVHLPGYVPYSRLAEYYGAADVFVHLPERGPWELSVAEAMACGLPVVSHKEVGAAVDLIRDGKTGFLANRLDPRDVARCLYAVAQWRDKGSVARTIIELVRNVADVRVTCRELEDLVRRVPDAPPFEPIWPNTPRPRIPHTSSGQP